MADKIEVEVQEEFPSPFLKETNHGPLSGGIVAVFCARSLFAGAAVSMVLLIAGI